MRVIFISPHFDDAIGSCAGLMQRLVSAGYSVRSETIFGGKPGDAPLSELARHAHSKMNFTGDLVETRILEDRRACESIGVAQGFAEFQDAIYRTDGMGRHLYDQGTLGLDIREPELEQAICAHIEKIRKKGDILFFPVGIGGHVDHTIVARAGQSFPGAIFYEEFLYDLFFPNSPKTRELKKFYFTPAEVDKKIAAFDMYQSQIPSCFQNRATMVRYFNLYRVGNDGGAPFERYSEDLMRNRAFSSLDGTKKIRRFLRKIWSRG